MTALPISYLFVPGNRPERFDKACASGAHAIILDLEDAVAPEAKQAARDAIGHWLAARGEEHPPLLVRINDISTPWFDADLEWLASMGRVGVMLSKAEDGVTLQRLRSVLPGGSVLVPLIETARGIGNVRDIAGAPGVQRLAFGTLDYALDMDLSDDERGLLFPASLLAIESRLAGLGSPIAGVTPALDDGARLLADWAFARSCGFGAKMCIHPSQVLGLHRAVQPSADELAWARRVVQAAQDSPGAASVDGRMVDKPVLLKAQALLARA